LQASLHLHGTGQGQTVAIVDAYDNPYIQRDLTRSSKQFGLPPPCTASVTTGCFHLSVVHPYGFAGVDPGWALESSLDTQMVHAMAPEASIVLVEAHDSSLVRMFEAVDYAAGLKASVISNSWGLSEFSGQTSGDGHCALAHSLCVFSTGDSGNPGQYPAYSPYVLSVGGTTLSLTSAGAVDFEVGWCCSVLFSGATGGGVSQYESRPAYQDKVNPYQGRGTPDVSFDADPFTGVAVYDTVGLFGQNGWFQVGGTSVGAPAWSGIVAVVDQLRATAGKPPLVGAGFQAQTLLYNLAGATGFGDITVGADNATQCAGLPVQACQAQPGYDLVSGWGSPRPGIDIALAAAR
jgi:subtilase family serine protease